MRRDQLPEAKKLRERAHELKLKADHFAKDADDLIRQAEEIEKKTTRREDVNRAALDKFPQAQPYETKEFPTAPLPIVAKS